MNRVLLAVGLAILLLFAYLTAIQPAYALAYALCLLFVVAWAWPRLVLRGIEMERMLDPGSPTLGEAFQETFCVRTRSPVPGPWVEVIDLSRLPGYQPGRVISLGRRPVTWKAHGVYRQRGWVTFGPTLVRVREPFGLFSCERRLGDAGQVLVYPRVRPLPELLLPAAQHAGAAERYGNWADYPPETGGVRDYAPGDAFGRIHWPLSQRHQRLMSKTFEQPLTADLWVVLDLDRRVHWGEGEESTLEYAICLAASVAMQVHDRGRTVGLIANDARGTLLEPHRAVRQDRAIMDYLAGARADGLQTLGRALAWDRVRRLPRRALAVITPSSDPGWIEAMQAMRGRGTSLIAFYLDAASFGAPGPSLSFELGSDLDLYVVRRGDDLSRLVRTRDAVRLA
ncbi:MAG TPA: DUF58 domain-containing protein [Candidatus Dormibacteraeota bacterium]|nr:DUF58 domain-containing protein [Candidatus Dormibacteraeota bacterium]